MSSIAKGWRGWAEVQQVRGGAASGEVVRAQGKRERGLSFAGWSERGGRGGGTAARNEGVGYPGAGWAGASRGQGRMRGWDEG